MCAPFYELWYAPFVLDVPSEVLKAGEVNVLTERVHNSTAAGGIHEPVHGHAPHSETLRPLPPFSAAPTTP